jgi:CheY-like chemotaxis protein
LDISLPAGNGFLVAQRLRAMIGSAATPIIFISSSDDPALRERAMKLGSAFLKKPLGAGALADAIESALAPGEDWGPPQAV